MTPQPPSVQTFLPLALFAAGSVLNGFFAPTKGEKGGQKPKTSRNVSQSVWLVLIAELSRMGIWTNFDFGCYRSSAFLLPLLLYLESAQKQREGIMGSEKC